MNVPLNQRLYTTCQTDTPDSRFRGITCCETKVLQISTLLTSAWRIFLYKNIDLSQNGYDGEEGNTFAQSLSKTFGSRLWKECVHSPANECLGNANCANMRALSKFRVIEARAIIPLNEHRFEIAAMFRKVVCLLNVFL